MLLRTVYEIRPTAAGSPVITKSVDAKPSLSRLDRRKAHPYDLPFLWRAGPSWGEHRDQPETSTSASQLMTK